MLICVIVMEIYFLHKIKYKRLSNVPNSSLQLPCSEKHSEGFVTKNVLLVIEAWNLTEVVVHVYFAVI